MSYNKIASMTKREIAELLQVATEDLYMWAQPTAFSDWLDVCPEWLERLHDENDIQIFTLISQINNQIDRKFPFHKRIELIKRELRASPIALRIKEKRGIERSSPEIVRWSMFSNGPCLKYQYEWLKPLPFTVDSIADFGCWASSEWSTCSEPYALLWTLEASRVAVVDKNPEYIKNAQEWLKNTRLENLYFEDYNLEFIVGDMIQNELQGKLPENNFDLSFCQNVLYNMYDNSEDIQNAVNEMVRVVKPGGCIIAIEPKVDEDISSLFEAVGLIRLNVDSAPYRSYCYNKP